MEVLKREDIYHLSALDYHSKDKIFEFLKKHKVKRSSLCCLWNTFYNNKLQIFSSKQHGDCDDHLFDLPPRIFEIA